MPERLTISRRVANPIVRLQAFRRQSAAGSPRERTQKG